MAAGVKPSELISSNPCLPDAPLSESEQLSCILSENLKQAYRLDNLHGVERWLALPEFFGGFVHNALWALQSDHLSPKSDNFPPKVCPFPQE